MKKAIVTGASGFVGSWLVRRLLENGVRVTAVELPGNANIKRLPVHENLSIVFCEPSGELSLSQIIKDRGFDVFYNLAWNGAGGPNRANYTIQLHNVKMCLDYLTAADSLQCDKFISVGTIGEYMAELAANNNIVSENFMYATCKSFTEKMLRIAAHKLSCQFIWCTFCGLYGPGDGTPNLVNYTIKNLLNGVSPQYGPAEQPFDFLHISDCVNALYLIGKSNTAVNSFFIGSGSPRPLKEFLYAIQQAVCPQIKVGIGERPDDGTVYKLEWYDIQSLVKETGFKPNYSFQSGILETAEWLKTQL
ncbi:NAD-dependent epimerase/dehydratase family protein [Caproiciproducens sp.]|uniref:NAD-dependent epimerase/dehydratase family protein n=1 Tax=Caproiciproducens sp. TaxID=1954376 RepID=UPI0028992BF0|nr:NAD(P)-dependent oxidoreductase [Caproiciproducens sp.]